MARSEKKRANKPLKSQKEQRVMEVYDLLLKDYTRPKLLEYCGKKWGLGRSSADTLMQLASKIIKEDIEATRDSKLASLLKKQDDLYAEILATRPLGQHGEQAPNFGAARQVLMDQAKLLGLEKQRIVHSVDDGDEEFDSMSDEQLDEELADGDTS